MTFKKFAKDFGSKEIILNYGNRRWGFTKTNKVGQVMAMIRQCQPRTFQEWEDWYFKNAFTNTKQPIKITREILTELGQRLYEKITEIVAPQLREALTTLALQDCIDYIYELTIHRTFDGYLTEKSVVHDTLAQCRVDQYRRSPKGCFGIKGYPFGHRGYCGDKISRRIQKGVRENCMRAIQFQLDGSSSHWPDSTADR
jgi:hypothetical protein